MTANINALIRYGLDCGLIEPGDEIYVFNRLLEILGLDAPGDSVPAGGTLPEILGVLEDDAVRRGLIGGTVTERDLFDTKLMSALTPFPHEVRRRFSALYAESPEAATDWFYKFSGDTNYIRRDRIERDLRWVYDCEYGSLDISINLSKPEKDPRAIAAARLAPQSGYPRCQLCRENEGYAGRLDHPARQNHRIVPVTLAGEEWFMQYSPYVYYNEHCIVLNSRHVPMKIDRSAIDRLLDFVRQFPHYFIGSNADLPIVGGSILSHDHFQGGRYEFAMAKAPVETELRFPGYESVAAEIVRWPMSVIRLRSEDRDRLAALADAIICAWRGYSDESAAIIAETDGVPHNTVTPIARRRDGDYELDLVLRNNLTTAEYPLGLYHPHPELHHIKKENIGLIEVMGLAVLPSRLNTELSILREALIDGTDPAADQRIAAHADWAKEMRGRYSFDRENADEILRRETGAVFLHVLEDAGVYKRSENGRAAFLKFTAFAGGKEI